MEAKQSPDYSNLEARSKLEKWGYTLVGHIRDSCEYASKEPIDLEPHYNGVIKKIRTAIDVFPSEAESLYSRLDSSLQEIENKYEKGCQELENLVKSHEENGTPIFTPKLGP